MRDDIYIFFIEYDYFELSQFTHTNNNNNNNNNNNALMHYY